MKTNFLSTILLMVIVLLFCQCTKTEFDDFSKEERMENLPESSKQLGLAVAAELNATVRNLHKQGIDYSNANESPEFKEVFYNDFFKASPSAIKTRSSNSDFNISPKEFVRRVNNLTRIQREFLNRIIDECGASKTDDEFYAVLISINSDIYKAVPEIQQERLFNVTSVLYYSMKEIQKLECQGFVIPTPRSNMQQVLVKTRSETGGSFGDTCRKFLATTWAIAIGEPTPAGEIVASVITVVVAGVLLYEVVVCSKSSTGSGSGSNYDYCQSKFRSCYSPIFDGCSICLQFCLTQGYWPPYSTHKCS